MVSGWSKLLPPPFVYGCNIPQAIGRGKGRLFVDMGETPTYVKLLRIDSSAIWEELETEPENIEYPMSKGRLPQCDFIIRHSLFDIHHSIGDWVTAMRLHREDLGRAWLP
jgi:hypothetical protein